MKGLLHPMVEIYTIENQSLWQRLNSFENLKKEPKTSTNKLNLKTWKFEKYIFFLFSSSELHDVHSWETWRRETIYRIPSPCNSSICRLPFLLSKLHSGTSSLTERGIYFKSIFCDSKCRVRTNRYRFWGKEQKIIVKTTCLGTDIECQTK